jgi:hypothetical protein
MNISEPTNEPIKPFVIPEKFELNEREYTPEEVNLDDLVGGNAAKKDKSLKPGDLFEFPEERIITKEEIERAAKKVINLTPSDFAELCRTQIYNLTPILIGYVNPEREKLIKKILPDERLSYIMKDATTQAELTEKKETKDRWITALIDHINSPKLVKESPFPYNQKLNEIVEALNKDNNSRLEAIEKEVLEAKVKNYIDDEEIEILYNQALDLIIRDIKQENQRKELEKFKQSVTPLTILNYRAIIKILKTNNLPTKIKNMPNLTPKQRLEISRNYAEKTLSQNPEALGRQRQTIHERTGEAQDIKRLGEIHELEIKAGKFINSIDDDPNYKKFLQKVENPKFSQKQVDEASIVVEEKMRDLITRAKELGLTELVQTVGRLQIEKISDPMRKRIEKLGVIEE